MSRSALAEKHPWTLPWYKVEGENVWVLVYLVVLHVMVAAGLIFFPLPGWKIFSIAFFFACLGGLGTTLGYHRALSHRAVKLHPVIEQFLIFCAVFNGSGSPTTWVANHRNHHSTADTIDDVSSPRHGGFWWAHLRCCLAHAAAEVLPAPRPLMARTRISSPTTHLMHLAQLVEISILEMV